MVSGGSRMILIASVLVGTALLGGIVGAGIDYASGNSGWWGAGALAGIIVAALAASAIVEGRRIPRRS